MLKQKLPFIIKSLLYVGFITASLYATHIWFPGSEWLTASFIFLILAATWLLPELLTVWLLVLGTTAIVMITIFGVSYIPIPERVFYIFLLPLMGVASLHLKRLAFRLSVGNEQEAAQETFETFKKADGSTFPLQIGMTKWSHFEQFREINPKESRRIVDLIKERLKAHSNVRHVFALADGNFLLFADNQIEPASLKEQLKASLSDITFQDMDNSNAIQFQSTQDTWEKAVLEPVLFADLIKQLERKLETEIIIEY